MMRITHADITAALLVLFKLAVALLLLVLGGTLVAYLRLYAEPRIETAEPRIETPVGDFRHRTVDVLNLSHAFRHIAEFAEFDDNERDRKESYNFTLLQTSVDAVHTVVEEARALLSEQLALMQLTAGDTASIGTLLVGKGVAAPEYRPLWGGDAYSWLESASTVRVASAHADDTSSGAGVQAVTVHGLDADWDPVSATIVPAGTGEGAESVEQFVRVFRAYVNQTGTARSLNQGRIDVKAGAALVAVIQPETGVSHDLFYTVPRRKRLYVSHVRATASMDKLTNVRCYAYLPDGGLQMLFETSPFSGTLTQSFGGHMGPYPERTDVWCEAAAAAGDATTELFLDVLVVG